jgi:hypothetical protein
MTHATRDTIFLGDVIHCVGVLRKIADDTLLDPTDAFGWFIPPDGVMVTYEYGVGVALVRDSAGQYSFDISCDDPGNYTYGFYSTGTGQAGSPDGKFRVSSSARQPA